MHIAQVGLDHIQQQLPAAPQRMPLTQRISWIAAVGKGNMPHQLGGLRNGFQIFEYHDVLERLRTVGTLAEWLGAL